MRQNRLFHESCPRDRVAILAFEAYLEGTQVFQCGPVIGFDIERRVSRGTKAGSFTPTLPRAGVGFEAGVGDHRHTTLDPNAERLCPIFVELDHLSIRAVAAKLPSVRCQ